jgi:hypothetical protein
MKADTPRLKTLNGWQKFTEENDHDNHPTLNSGSFRIADRRRCFPDLAGIILAT